MVVEVIVEVRHTGLFDKIPDRIVLVRLWAGCERSASLNQPIQLVILEIPTGRTGTLARSTM